MQSQTVSREKLRKTHLYRKAAHKMLVNITNIHNILAHAFTCKDPYSTNNTVKPSVFFWGFGDLQADLNVVVLFLVGRQVVRKGRQVFGEEIEEKRNH